VHGKDFKNLQESIGGFGETLYDAVIDYEKQLKASSERAPNKSNGEAQRDDF
jgi:hypothetical protein